MGTVTMDMLNVLPREVPATSTPKKSKTLDNSPVIIVNDADSTLDSIFPEPDFDMKENDSDSDSMFDENDLVKCKSRLDGKSTKGTTVARRNERERNRVKHINRTFTLLRQHLPAKKANKKLSKVETLRSAVMYIKQLQEMIDDHDTMATSAYNFEQAYLVQNQPQFTLPRQRIPNHHHLQHRQHHLHHMQAHQMQMHHQPQQPMYNLMDPLTNVGALTTPVSPVTRVRAPSVSSSVYSAPSPVSPTNSVFSANSPSYSSDSSWEALGPEEADDLVDFTRKAILEITEMGGW